MKLNVKNILIVGIIILILFVLLLLKLNDGSRIGTVPHTENSQVPVVTESEPPLPFGQITRDEVIKHVEWAYRNGKPYEQVALTKDGPKDYVVTFYQPNPRDENLKTWQEQRGGILVFHIKESKPELIWESTDDITLTRPLLAVRDLTGDGVNEIVAMWQNGASEILYIYELNDKKKTFELITPLGAPFLAYGSTTSYPIFDGPDSTIQIIDLDGDKIPEIIILGLVTPDKNNTEDGITRNDKRPYEAYKWNGTKYYLWKTSEKPFAAYEYPF